MSVHFITTNITQYIILQIIIHYHTKYEEGGTLVSFKIQKLTARKIVNLKQRTKRFKVK